MHPAPAFVAPDTNSRTTNGFATVNGNRAATVLAIISDWADEPIWHEAPMGSPHMDERRADEDPAK
jgi:hypothetical protein